MMSWFDSRAGLCDPPSRDTLRSSIDEGRLAASTILTTLEDR